YMADMVEVAAADDGAANTPPVELVAAPVGSGPASGEAAATRGEAETGAHAPDPGSRVQQESAPEQTIKAAAEPGAPDGTVNRAQDGREKKDTSQEMDWDEAEEEDEPLSRPTSETP